MLVPAAVLMPIILRDPEATVLFTQRATALKNHAGQISFPGGRLESSDASPIAAALREAQEEVGLDPQFVTVTGFLPDHIIGHRISGDAGGRLRASRVLAHPRCA
ncbi:MAG: CoA pyrophosphatase [Steroidobacteraceae bacterium]